MRSPRLAWLAALGGVLLTTTAAADWPLRRHDPQHTGTSPGEAALERPAVTWRYNLGATLDSVQLITADADGDGTHEIILIEGGRVVALTLADDEVWSRSIDSAAALPITIDFDGDSLDELVVTTSSGFVYLLSLADGSTLWRSPNVGSMPSVRVGQFDEDARPELLVVRYKSSRELFVDFDGAPGDTLSPEHPERVRTWWTHNDPAQPERNDRGQFSSGHNAALADLDGDGIDEVVVPARSSAFVYDSSTGLAIPPHGLEGTGHPLATPVAPSPCGFRVDYGNARSSVFAEHLVAAGDAAGGSRQAIIFSNDSSTNGRQLFSLHWDPVEPVIAGALQGRLRVRAHWAAAMESGDRHRRIDDAVADLDGDGSPEVVTGGRIDGLSAIRVLSPREPDADGLGAWRGACDTLRYDDRALGVIPDARPLGIWPDAYIDIETGEARPLVLAERDGTLIAYAFETDVIDGRLEFIPVERFQLQGASPIRVYDPELSRRGSAQTRLLTFERGARRALVVDYGRRLEVLSIDANGLHVDADYTPPHPLTVQQFFMHRDIEGGLGLIALRSDGRLVILDTALEPQSPEGMGQAPIRVVSHTAGISSTRPPLATRFDGPADEVIVAVSSGGIVRLDARGASLTSPPRRRWSWAGARLPALWDLDSDDIPEIIAYDGDSIEARAADGRRVLFRTRVAGDDGQAGYRAAVPGVAPEDPNGVRLHALMRDVDAGNVSIVVIGSSGELDWTTGWLDYTPNGVGFVTPDDFDGQGAPAVFLGLQHVLRWFGGDDGELVRWGFAERYPEWLVVVRGLAGETTHILTTASHRPNRFHGVHIDGATSEWRTTFGLAFETGQNGISVLTCPDRRAVLVGSEINTNRLRRFDVEDGGREGELRLAGGRAYRVAEEIPPDDVGGLLGPVTGIGALYGNRPAVVAGSTDGHLYAVDPCPIDGPELIWSLDLGRSVGTPIFADTDGDRAEEIVVAAADGYLYGIDTALMTPPAWVRDVDAVDALDDIDRTESPVLHFTWAEVPDAIAYEYVVLDGDERPLTPFVRARETRATYAGEFTFGARYSVAVRALGHQGASPEAFSDGVRWMADLCADRDDDGACANVDCHPGDPERHPGADEVCHGADGMDGVDDDCDGTSDEGCPCFDGDGDGVCLDEGDCDDADPGVRPDVAERCDGADDDCDGLTDEGCIFSCADADRDGSCDEDDCADNDPQRHPGAEEVENGVDDDCDHAVDEGFPVCVDDDGDGICAPFNCSDRDADGACDAQDCRPDDPAAHPGALERPGDGRDNDCDGLIDEFVCVDNDRDGVCAEVDCDDDDADIHPGRDEVKDNERDDNCDGLVDVLACTRPDGGVPGEEFCGNGLDDDCDGIIDEGCRAARRRSDGCSVSGPTGSEPWPSGLPMLLALVGLVWGGRPRR